MTEDQIKAIAEEYAKHKVTQKYVWRFHTESDLKAVFQVEAIKLLQYLSDRYCIVEREKVMEIAGDIEASSGYVEIPQLNERIKVVTIDTLNRISIDYFDTSMFNKNEE